MREVAQQMFDRCSDERVDAIVIAGDTWHAKLQGITPEAIDQLVWFFKTAASVAKTYVIVGNHDMNCNNASRRDVISPLVSAIADTNVTLLAKSGVYDGPPGIKFGVFSLLDEHRKGAWDRVVPVDGSVNVALYHGIVGMPISDSSLMRFDNGMPITMFDGFDYVLLGDIHRHQFMTNDRRIAYPGSMMTQNFGEDGKKGFILWDIAGKDEFEAKFIELKQPHPHVTVKWQGDVESTISAIQLLPNNCRYRIKSDVLIVQDDIRRLHNELKRKDAVEIAYKIDNRIDTDIIVASSGSTLFKDDLRDASVQKRLLRQYIGEQEFIDAEWTRLDTIVDRALKSAVEGDAYVKNTKWSINRLQFENTFGYGKGNVIDFTKLRGITGVFGPNKSGKSSLIGTMIYTLFNTTDRGPVKNLHVINTQKGYCSGSIALSINADEYVVERASVKHENKKAGEIYAVTSVDFTRVDAIGNEVEKLNGTQRTDTDAKIRSMIGTADDFMLTSVAAQGNMGKFLDHGSAQRRMILARFLGLDVFDRMYEVMKKDADVVKAGLARFTDHDWETKLTMLDEALLDHVKIASTLDKRLMAARSTKANVDARIMALGGKDIITQDDVAAIEKMLARVQNERDACTVDRDAGTSEQAQLSVAKDRLQVEHDAIDIAHAREQIRKRSELEKALVRLEADHRAQLDVLDQKEKSARKLKTVPCGSAFPKCRFIKDSYDDAQTLEAHRQSIAATMESISAAKEALKDYDDGLLDAELERAAALRKKIEAASQDIARLKDSIEAAKSQIAWHDASIEKLQSELASAREHVVGGNVSMRIATAKSRLRKIEGWIERLDTQRLKNAAEKGRIESELASIKRNAAEYKKLSSEWHIYERLLYAVSKKGLPFQITRMQLPAINAEIAKILSGIVDFTVELEADEDQSSMDVYIDDGLSRRYLELGSGMEKLIGGLAIRVALVNVSSLPKAEMLVIDEGFGSLDDVYMDAIGRMLKSLSRYFRNLIIITHVDAMKDIVDNIIEVELDAKKRSRLEAE